MYYSRLEKFIIQGNVYNGQVKMTEKEGIVKYQYENKNTIIYNPDSLKLKIQTIDFKTN